MELGEIEVVGDQQSQRSHCRYHSAENLSASSKPDGNQRNPEKPGEGTVKAAHGQRRVGVIQSHYFSH